MDDSSVSLRSKEYQDERLYHVIQEVYNSSNAHQRFAAELDRVLEEKVRYIVIEPPRLGDETGRWITFGNCLHKTAVLTGTISIILWPQRPIIAGPICALSLFCTGLYTVSWNCDPCCQYQATSDDKTIKQLPLTDVSSPVILKYTPNTKATYLHRTITLLSAAFCVWQIWRSYK